MVWRKIQVRLLIVFTHTDKKACYMLHITPQEPGLVNKALENHQHQRL